MTFPVEERPQRCLKRRHPFDWGYGRVRDNHHAGVADPSEDHNDNRPCWDAGRKDAVNTFALAKYSQERKEGQIPRLPSLRRLSSYSELKSVTTLDEPSTSTDAPPSVDLEPKRPSLVLASDKRVALYHSDYPDALMLCCESANPGRLLREPYAAISATSLGGRSKAVGLPVTESLTDICWQVAVGARAAL